MMRLSAFWLLAGLAFAMPAAHAAPAAGAWEMAIGVRAQPCPVTLKADQGGDSGTIAPAPRCGASTAEVARWRTSPGGVTLLSASGELLAFLKPEGDSYVGNRYEDSRKVVLRRPAGARPQ
jgi:hypothetical protein